MSSVRIEAIAAEGAEGNRGRQEAEKTEGPAAAMRR